MFRHAPVQSIEQAFKTIARDNPVCTLRLVERRLKMYRARRGVQEPVFNEQSVGCMVSVNEHGGSGYAATADLSPANLARAAADARERARVCAAHALFDASRLPAVTARESIDLCAAEDLPSVEDCVSLTREASDNLRAAIKRRDTAGRVVDWSASVELLESSTLLLTSTGGRIAQRYFYLSPGMSVVANDGAQTQQRSHNGGHHARQGGLGQFHSEGFFDQTERLVDEALALLDAPECPENTADLLLMPGQMALQIHESIGHPLELDRILGDERNYAGGSFVSPDMFGSYRYGSERLNVRFEPDRTSEVACFRFDDEGTEAVPQYLIKDGILVAAIGSAASQIRAGVPAAASARALEWNRAPIDRMGNINLLPGASGLDEMVGSIERGILMDTNRSWSIDQQRNKFQFGCEYGQIIEHGELKGLVRNPGYRGRSASFWRSLDKVGDGTTQSMLGTLYCGKGEPNQLVHVGHASPACVFRNVEIFGGR